MPQREGIERTREESHTLLFLQRRLLKIELIVGDETVNMVQRCRIIVKAKFRIFIRLNQRQHLLAHDLENIEFFLQAQMPGSEDLFPDDHESFLADRLMVVGKPPQQHADNSDAMPLEALLRLDIVIVFHIVIEKNRQRIERDPGHPIIAALQQMLQFIQRLVKALQRKLGDHNAKIVRNVFGKLILTDLQALGELDNDL